MSDEAVPNGLEDQPEMDEETGGCKPPARRRLRLTNLREIRIEMAKVYVAARRGKIDVRDGSRLVNMLSLLARTYESDVIERRLRALEEAANARR